jgi:hypothetical protein
LLTTKVSLIVEPSLAARDLWASRPQIRWLILPLWIIYDLMLFSSHCLKNTHALAVSLMLPSQEACSSQPTKQ